MSLKEAHESFSSTSRGTVHEDRRLQIEELDEWRMHKPRTPDKLKLRQNEPDTSPNQLKVGDKVLLDTADPHIVTTTMNEEIPLTILSIFPLGTVEVSHPKFDTFKAHNVIFERKENHRTYFKEEEGSVLFPLLTIDPWELFFGIIKLTYLELTMELCSMFHLQTIMTYYDNPSTVQFCLGGLIHQLSVPEFGAALGLYTEEFKEENELHALSRHIHFSPSKCWHTLVPNTASYNPSHSKASVLPPSLRARHRPCLFHRPCNLAPDGAASEGGHLYWPLHVSTSHLEHAEHEDDREAPRNLPSPHEDPPTQPPPPSPPVHAAASYADISERLTRFEQ
ncbi:hypothetical protein GOBAR_AA21322 [Gossypium barbadense]|uniref:Uncharacterized protein n=1 Tax=Gossypium barbadense TaxID=3634 RepID=A0A2P5X7P2_GOSBA|nr:hypothetical protein GOBAR_AA21322 [Gossypium barbadense]